jgi:hypothetical protein
MLLQRSTTRVCHALLRFLKQMIPAYSAKISRTYVPSYTMWFRQFTKYVTKTDHKIWCHPHSIEHDTQPIVFLISKQVVPYLWHLDSRLNRIDRILISPRYIFFSISPTEKNSEVMCAGPGAISGWVADQEVFPGAHKWGQKCAKNTRVDLWG